MIYKQPDCFVLLAMTSFMTFYDFFKIGRSKTNG